MANVICKKCGLKAGSKCPHCRTVFPDNQMEAVLSNVFHHSVADGILTMSYLIGRDVTEEEGLRRLYEMLHGCVKAETRKEDSALQMPTLKELACHHEWEFAPGHSSSIGCGHGSEEQGGAHVR